MEELCSLADWPQERLSRLLVYLAPLGGTGWPTRLCELGAVIDFVGDEGETALSQCVHGARKNEDGSRGNDTFGTAIELLALGANPNATYLSMFSVTHLATVGNQPEFAALFLLSGADLERQEPDRFRTETLREAMLKSADIIPQMQGKPWPKQIISILDKRK